MFQWSRASRCLAAAMLVAMTMWLAGGCSSGGSPPPRSNELVSHKPNPDAKPVIIDINYDPKAKAYVVTCDAKLRRKDEDLLWFNNHLSASVTITFGGTSDSTVTQKSPFDPDTTSFQAPPGFSSVFVTRGPNPNENTKVLVFVYTVNGQKPVCGKLMTGEPGVTVGD